MKSLAVARHSSLLVVAALSLVGSACDTNSSSPNSDAGTDSGGPIDMGVDLGTVAPATVFCGPDASTYLHSSSDGIDIVVIGSSDPLSVVSSSSPRCFMYGKMMSDAATSLQYGTYELDGTGNGAIHITTAFSMPNESTLAVSARGGAERTDFATAFDFPLVVTQGAGGTTFQIDAASHAYTRFDDVVAAIDFSGGTAFTDTYQLYNVALTLTQMRMPGFGGLGMTKYIGATPTVFDALTAGTYSVRVLSLVNPTATIAYAAAEDLPGAYFDGAMITMANLMGNGPMSGSISFEFRETGSPTGVLLSGSVDYSNITVMNANAASGYYLVTVAGQPAPAQVPYTVAATRDLSNILPVTP